MERSKPTTTTTTLKITNHNWSLYLTCFLSASLLLIIFNTSLFSNTTSSSITLLSNSYKPQPQPNTTHQSPLLENNPDPCRDRYIHILDLPTTFNTDILKDCKALCKWFDMCPFLPNNGLGPRVNTSNGVIRGPSWYVTNQFSLEIVFHNRMIKYECLTNDSSLASLVYVPYYAGLDVGRYLWSGTNSDRDELSLDMVKRVAQTPFWKTMSGHDHFLVVGRPGTDFSREYEDWGNQLEFFPETKNMTVLIIEALPVSKDFGIPYPTYFHPTSEAEVFQWQETVRLLKRPYLFSFIGVPRPHQNSSIRGQIIEQCLASNQTCKFLNCQHMCDDPIDVIGFLEKSTFCLQPPGDSFTRKSTFDSILAGCIPVLFHPQSAYAQYKWYLPEDNTTYSVFIPESEIKEGKTNIEEVLLGIPEERVAAMREEVVKLIPKIIYAISKLETVKDAFDIAIDGLLHKVRDARKQLEIEKSKVHP